MGEKKVQFSLREITIDDPWNWLNAGWADLRTAPSVGLGYGLLFTIASFFMLFLVYRFDTFEIFPALIGGFFLVAPILAVGLYETSRRLEQGQSVSMALALTAWKRNFGQIAFMGILLVLAWLAWIRLAALIFMFFFSEQPPDPAFLLDAIFFDVEALPFLLFGTLVGAVMAAFVFAISAISIPLLLEHEVDAFRAIHTSVRAVRKNPFPSFVWASLIVLFTSAGVMTFYIGLVVTAPLIGHATWHAYRGLVVVEET